MNKNEFVILLILLVLAGNIFYSFGCGLSSGGSGSALLLTCAASELVGTDYFLYKFWDFTLSIKNWMSKKIVVNSSLAEISAATGNFSITLTTESIEVDANTTIDKVFGLWSNPYTTYGSGPAFTSGDMTVYLRGTMEGGTRAQGSIKLKLI